MDIVQHSLDRDRDHHRVLYGSRNMTAGDVIVALIFFTGIAAILAVAILVITIMERWFK